MPATTPLNDGGHEYEDDQDDISLLDLLQVVVDNLRLLVLGPLAAGLAALGISFAIAPTFTATTRFMPPQQQASSSAALLAGLGALGGATGMVPGFKNPTDQYVAFTKSDTVANALIDRFKLIERYEVELKIDARKTLTDVVRLSSGKDGLIKVEVDDKDATFAAILANAHVEELTKLLNRLAVTEAQQRRVFFEKQLATAKDNLVKAEIALKASGVNSSALKATPVAAVEGLARLKAGVTAQEIKLASMRGYLNETSPDFKQAQTELAAMRSQLARTEKPEPTSQGDADYIARYRDFKYFETLFELFAKQFELAKVDEAKEGAGIQVVDVAQPPERKSKPKKMQLSVAITIFTAFGLLIFVFMRHAFRHTSKSPQFAKKCGRLRSSLQFARVNK
jgi:uncharacterized protein involved in exopolysaccharide biosynthesis